MTFLSVSASIGTTIDIIIVAVLVVFALIGLREGFFKSVLSMISTVVVVVVSFFGANPVAKLVNKIYDFTGLIAGKLCKSIASMGAFYSETIPSGVSGADLANNIPSSTNGFLKKIMSYVLKPLSSGEVEGSTVAKVVSGAFASIIFTIIIGILLFILIKIVLAIASKLFENITRNKVFGAVNKICGFVFGTLKGGLMIVVLSLVLTFLTVIPAVNNKVSPIINNNTNIAKPIYAYTDKLVEKYVINSNVIQKWINNLWENKKSGSSTTEEVKGTKDNPYILMLINNEGVLSSEFNISFKDDSTAYYLFNPSEIASNTFTLAITLENANYELYSSDNTTDVISDYTLLDRTKNYIIGFTRNNTEMTQIDVTITLTGNVE